MICAIPLHRDSDESRNSRVAIDERSHELVNNIYSLKMYAYAKHLSITALHTR